MKKRVFIFSFYICFIASSHAQVIIKNLQATAANAYQATISWTVGASTFASSGLEIQTSLDSFVNYVSLYTWPTPVGGNSADQDMSWTHNNPDVHKKNYYRLYSPGGGYSGIVMVDFGAINGAYNIYPDPLTDNSMLTFDNPNNENYVLKIANVTGNQSWIFPDLTTNQMLLPKSWFVQGIYYFRLINQQTGRFTRGKFIVIE